MKQMSKAAGYGIFSIFIVVIIASFVLSLLLRFTTITEDALQPVILATSLVAMFIGGFIAGKKGGQSGWLVGALTGTIYTAIVFFIQFLGFSESFNLMQYVYHAGYIFIAVIGGAIGVHFTANKAQ